LHQEGLGGNAILSTVKARLSRLGRNVLKYRLLRDVSIRSDRFGREHMVDLAVRFVKNNRIEGSYLEFGVWRGSTFAQFHHTLRRYRIRAAMYAFDSFAGLPEPRGLDRPPGHEPFRAGQFSCSEQEFIAELRGRRVQDDAYTIVPGFYDRTLTAELARQLDLSRAALVWIDSVLYESAEPVLDFIAPLLQDGAILMFNDFFRFRGSPQLGERKAFDEFQREHPEIAITDYAKFGSVGQAFIVHTG